MKMGDNFSSQAIVNITRSLMVRVAAPIYFDNKMVCIYIFLYMCVVGGGHLDSLLIAHRTK